MSNQIPTTHRDIAWFKQADELRQLEMSPPFQRNLVWTDKQKSFLIDSILNGFPVPEIYMQDIVDDTGNKKYILVDGQQRITACLEYINNDFPIDSNDSPSYGRMLFDDLNPNDKKKIYSYTFVTRLLPEMSDSELREIFSRLNRNNVVLNAQELRQATYWGQFIQTMNEISNNDLWRDLGIFTANDVKRMLDVEFISELSIAILHGVQNKKQTIDKYYEIYEDNFDQKNELKYTFDILLRELVRVLPDFNKTRWSKKTDFYSLFILFAKYKHLFPFDQQKTVEAAELLHRIGEEINIAVSTKDTFEYEDTDEYITQYSLNLRASSDLGARKKREEALLNLLSPLFM